MPYTGTSIVDYLKSVKQDSSYSSRAKLAEQHGIKGYTGQAGQNLSLLEVLRKQETTAKMTQPTPLGLSDEIQTRIKATIEAYKSSYAEDGEGARERMLEQLSKTYKGDKDPAIREFISKEIYERLPDVVKKEGASLIPTVHAADGEVSEYQGKIGHWMKEGDPNQGYSGVWKPGYVPYVKPEVVVKPDPIVKSGTGEQVKVDDQQVIDDTKQKVIEIGDDVNKTIQGIFDEAKDDEEIDMRDSAKILADLKEKIETSLTTEAEKPQSMAELFKAERVRLGLDVLETELSDIDAEIDLINTNLLVEAEKAGEQLLSMGEIGREKGVLQKRADRELAYLNIERKAVAQRMDNKLSTLEIMMNLTQQDFANTSAYYKTKLDKQTTLYNLYKGEEEEVVTRQDKLRDEAQFNLNTIHNLLKAQGSTWDSLSENNKTKIRELEIQAGLPTGITEAFSNANPGAEVMTTIIGEDPETGKTVVTYIYKDANGFPGVVKSVILDQVKDTTSDTIFTTSGGEEIDVSTTEGVRTLLKEEGATYDTVYNYLDTQTKLTAGRIKELLEGAGSYPEADKNAAYIDLEGYIDKYKADWKAGGDRDAGTREEFAKDMASIITSLSKQEILDQIYKSVNEEWYEENTSGWRKFWGSPT